MSKTIFLHQHDPWTTLCTWLYKVMWMAHKAEELGHKPFINWHQNGGFLKHYEDLEMFAKEPNAYQWYFKQPFIENPTGEKEVWVWENPKWGANITDDNILMHKPLSYIKDYFKKNLIFNDTVNARGQALVDKYNIDFSKTIGLSWRGTDGITDGRIRMPIEKYYKYIDMALEAIPDAKILCTAEEATILQPLLDKYPQAFNIDEFYSSPVGSLQNPERFSPMSGYERGVQPALMVWLFSKCAWYIKNRSSTGAVASWLSDGKIINLAHEETLSYTKMDDQVEINGIKYPL